MRRMIFQYPHVSQRERVLVALVLAVNPWQAIVTLGWHAGALEVNVIEVRNSWNRHYRTLEGNVIGVILRGNVDKVVCFAGTGAAQS